MPFLHQRSNPFPGWQAASSYWGIASSRDRATPLGPSRYHHEARQKKFPLANGLVSSAGATLHATLAVRSASDAFVSPVSVSPPDVESVMPRHETHQPIVVEACSHLDPCRTHLPKCFCNLIGSSPPAQDTSSSRGCLISLHGGPRSPGDL